MENTMAITDLIIEGVETAGPSATVETLAMRMAEAGVGSIIIEENMKPVGIVTDRDIATRVDARDTAASSATARDIMTPDPVTATNDSGLLVVTNTMAEAAVRRLPIVNDNGTLVGIITLDDVMLLLATEMSNLGGVIQAESPPY